MRVLALSYWWFFPADNGARMRASSLLRALAQQHEVHLIAFTQEALSAEQRELAQHSFASVVDIPQKVWVPKRFEQIASLWQSTPASVRATFDAQIDTHIQSIAAKLKPDIAIGFTNHMIPYASRIQGVKRVLEDLEITNILDAYRSASPRRRMRGWLTWMKQQSYARDLLRSFHGCTVTSERERLYVQRLAPQGLPIHVIPNGATYDDVLPDIRPEPDTLIYPGALSFSANMDAMRYFLSEIFPLIRHQRPGVRLLITGKASDEQKRALAHTEAVEFTGYVPDIRRAVASAWAEVVPLREGGGTRLKILEALALGTPVIATSKGAEGLELQAGRDLLLADTPQQFAETTIRILSDAELRTKLGQNGRQIVKERYDWRMIAQEYTQFIAQMGVATAHELR